MLLVHATTVEVEGTGVLIRGPSGSGKSDLALRLIDRGWRLVADDRVALSACDGRLHAAAPATIAGLIEVRGVGLCKEASVPAPVALAIDLAAPPDRLPEPGRYTHDGLSVPLIALDPFGESAPLRVERALRQFGDGVEAPPVPDAHPSPAGGKPPMLIVTGLSGAGKSTTLRALEDLGYEAVDNLPLALVEAVLAGADDLDGEDRPLAFGIDARTRAFDATDLIDRIRQLRRDGTDIRLVYFDCADDELTRRFSETRRRHPLAGDRPAADGIERERALLEPLKRWADIVVDTTDLSAAELRRQVGDRFGRSAHTGLTITIESFGYAHGLPRDADLVFDMRFLANPHWDMALRPLTGEDPVVAAYVEADPAYGPAFERICDLLVTLLPSYGREGKAYLTIAFGCTGGRHRSVAVARAMARRLEAEGHAPVLLHRDLAKHGADAAVIGPEHQERSAA
jgi:RNase adaptor protein for sRNA GlmZ degradation